MSDNLCLLIKNVFSYFRMFLKWIKFASTSYLCHRGFLCSVGESTPEEVTALDVSNAKIIKICETQAGNHLFFTKRLYKQRKRHIFDKLYNRENLLQFCHSDKKEGWKPTLRHRDPDFGNALQNILSVRIGAWYLEAEWIGETSRLNWDIQLAQPGDSASLIRTLPLGTQSFA